MIRNTWNILKQSLLEDIQWTSWLRIDTQYILNGQMDYLFKRLIARHQLIG